MCVACKVIINQVRGAVADSLETILAMPEVIEKLGEEATELRQRLADADVASYLGYQVPAGGYAGIIERLVKHGVLKPEIWEILRHPSTPPGMDKG